MFEIKMPKMGESIEQATITKWFVKEGDIVEEDTVLLEIATDKVDSEIPSPVAGRVEKILFSQDAVVPVGKVIAIINTSPTGENDEKTSKAAIAEVQTPAKSDTVSITDPGGKETLSKRRFYSPLVKTMAKHENIAEEELDKIVGSGKNGRVRKDDVVNYLKNRDSKFGGENIEIGSKPDVEKVKVGASLSAGDEIIQMDRMRKLIASHMVASKQISPHVTNMVEADVTSIVKWREVMKEKYMEKYRVKLTYVPVFIDAAARAIGDFPLINSSVDGDNIIVKGSVNIGIAVAKPEGGLIVPVVRQANKLNLPGIAMAVSQLAESARNNTLSPNDIQDGTFTITNFGTFRNVMGTPIISQPQVAILATGTIEKKPAVVETEYGDIIVPRHKMFLSLSYDHRIIDGALGGAFLRRVADYLEQFDTKREI